MKITADKILILGDIHGDWRALNTMINKKRPEVVICCGDFGYWPDLKTTKTYTKDGEFHVEYEPSFEMKKIKIGDTGARIFWCPGNHEQWWTLEKEYGRRGTEPIQMLKDNQDVFYCPIGSVLTLNGNRILFVGGAESTDQEYRTLGKNWFPEEVINLTDYHYILDNVKAPVDMVVSHTCPTGFPMAQVTGRWDKNGDPSRIALHHLLIDYKPTLWAMGHWHDYKRGNNYGCEWVCLDYPNHGKRWHIWLDTKNLQFVE